MRFSFLPAWLVVATLFLWSGSLFAGDRKLPEAAVVLRGPAAPAFETVAADCPGGVCSLSGPSARAGSRADARYSDAGFFAGPVASVARAKPVRAFFAKVFGGSGCRGCR